RGFGLLWIGQTQTNVGHRGIVIHRDPFTANFRALLEVSSVIKLVAADCFCDEQQWIKRPCPVQFCACFANRFAYVAEHAVALVRIGVVWIELKCASESCLRAVPVPLVKELDDSE